MDPLPLHNAKTASMLQDSKLGCYLGSLILKSILVSAGVSCSCLVSMARCNTASGFGMVVNLKSNAVSHASVELVGNETVFAVSSQAGRLPGGLKFSWTSKQDYLQQWSFGIRHESMSPLCLDVEYAGNNSVHLDILRTINHNTTFLSWKTEGV